MVTAKTKIVNPQGMHMRPAQLFVNTMAKYKSDVTIVFNGKNINAKSIMGMMSLGLDTGEMVTVIADGPDEETAVEDIAKYLCSGQE